MGITYVIYNRRGVAARGEVTLVRETNPNPIASLVRIAENITRGKWVSLDAQVIAPEAMQGFSLERNQRGGVLLTL